MSEPVGLADAILPITPQLIAKNLRIAVLPHHFEILVADSPSPFPLFGQSPEKLRVRQTLVFAAQANGKRDRFDIDKIGMYARMPVTAWLLSDVLCGPAHTSALRNQSSNGWTRQSPGQHRRHPRPFGFPPGPGSLPRCARRIVTRRPRYFCPLPRAARARIPQGFVRSTRIRYRQILCAWH